MKPYLESAAKAQNASLEVAAGFADAYLNAVEHLAQLYIETSRATCEKSTEMALLCVEKALAYDTTALWNGVLQSGIPHFFSAPPQTP